MKKARIMLTAILVLGTLGGALAIKAKKVGGQAYWTTTVSGATDGARLNNAKTTLQGSGTDWYYTLAAGQAATNRGYITTTSL